MSAIGYGLVPVEAPDAGPVVPPVTARSEADEMKRAAWREALEPYFEYVRENGDES